MKSIILKGALVLTLGVATGALAQTEIMKKNPEQQTESQPAQSEKSTDVDVTAEQQTEIRQAITETKTEPILDINFEVNVGVVVPSTVKRLPLPPGIVQIVPAYADYEYFVLADSRIVIVDPDTLEIVLVIEK
ncbi:DUF1236 domain-containing protein (plasmid) [Phyllobacterium sp. A18/5-2]|uniref:DUF1236 domain-containing protein n=1 Tax=Phyllobacterium sp. A18/5-2 TaxID=2978392 RepID=UPI0021C61E7F|nr:DUF1236 domain-containing protein [Phyllobacterium sp. A18/5-2]UXN67045.1 DUF1236 domain-containing protein [Phyllobacterium sp. A18/5-2]